MRFERIFQDLEGRFDHHEQEEMRAVSEDLARAERAQLTLADRLRGTAARVLTVHLGPSLRLAGEVEEVGEDWLALREAGTGSRMIVPLGAVALVEGLSGRARPAQESVIAAPALGSVLRGIARDRSVVRLETTAGGITGRIAAVGANTIDVRTLPTGEAATVPGSSRITVAVTSLLAVIPR